MSGKEREGCPSLPLQFLICRFAKSDKVILEDFSRADAFGKLLKAAGEVAEQHAEMPTADVTAMYIALAQFTGSVYPDRLDFVDLVLTSCYKVSHISDTITCSARTI